jgi:hypothetical protein
MKEHADEQGGRSPSRNTSHGRSRASDACHHVKCISSAPASAQLRIESRASTVLQESIAINWDVQRRRGEKQVLFIAEDVLLSA